MIRLIPSIHLSTLCGLDVGDSDTDRCKASRQGFALFRGGEAVALLERTPDRPEINLVRDWPEGNFLARVGRRFERERLRDAAQLDRERYQRRVFMKENEGDDGAPTNRCRDRAKVWKNSKCAIDLTDGRGQARPRSSVACQAGRTLIIII